MLCATAKGQGSAAVVNRICQGNSAGACAMGRVALLRAPRPHGRAPLPHGRGEFVGLPDSSFGRCGSCARGWSPAPARRAWGHLRPTGACGQAAASRAALIFFFAKGRCPSRIRKTCSNCRCGTGPYTYVQALPRVHVRFWGRRQQYPRKATFRVGPQHREAPQARGGREHPRCRMAAEKTRPVENPCACVD